MAKPAQSHARRPQQPRASCSRCAQVFRLSASQQRRDRKTTRRVCPTCRLVGGVCHVPPLLPEVSHG